MQQTEKYKLNLIESSDPFLPDGLNANTQKVEEVLEGMEDGPLAEMDRRVTVLEGFKFTWGSYTGNNTTLTIKLPFTPVAVYCRCISQNYGYLVIPGKAPSNDTIKIVNGGFSVTASSGLSMNGNGLVATYIAFGKT